MKLPPQIAAAAAQALALATGAILLLTGCETTSETTLEADSAFYREARAFLNTGRTTQNHVLAKYGTPDATHVLGPGTLWTYRRTSTVVRNAFSGTHMGTERGASRYGGYQHTTQHTTVMELYFDDAGILQTYRIKRLGEAPP